MKNPIPKVAILLETMENWNRLVLKGFLSYANEVGPWHVWISSKFSGSLDCLPEDWDGEGIIARIDTPEFAHELQESGIPVINLSDDPEQDFPAPCIRTDDDVGIQLAIEHFSDRGLKNMGFFGPDHLANPRHFEATYRKALMKRGLSCHSLQVGGDEADLSQKLTRWLKELPKPIGILVWGHGYAREVVDACMVAGIPVPHEVAVLGGSYDELFSHACSPALSGIITPTECIGYLAAKQLHQLMQGEKVPNTTTFLPPPGIKAHLSTDTLAIEDPELASMIKFIREHACEEIGVADALEDIPVGRRAMERRFRKAFGHSPNDEIRRVRIEKARRLLSETDMQVQEIADSCGYATYNYFSNIFKRTTGLSPRDYRKRHRT